MRMRMQVSFALVTLAVAGAAVAADFWQEEEYRQWTERECRKLLEDSPWAKRHVPRSRVIVESLSPRQEGIDRARETNPRMEYQVQFRSGRPVREALVRMEQIRAQYDTMSSEQQRNFDQQAVQFLAVAFSDVVVVHVYYSANVPADDLELARYWQTQTLDTLTNSVFLMGRPDAKVAPVRYWVAQGARREFELFFPRLPEGRPLVGPEDKSLTLEFTHPDIRGQGESRVLIEFRVKKMVTEGEVVY